MPKVHGIGGKLTLLLACVFAFGGESAFAQNPAEVVGTSESPCCREPACTVFILNGAGNFFGTTDNFQSAIRRRGYPLELITYEWSHGRWRLLADQTDQAWAHAQGKIFAQSVLDHHQRNPGRPIHIVAHSAGAHVALVGLENLPPGIVKHVIFMAPSVSEHYDVRLALRAVGCQMTNYYSCRDWFYIGVVTRVVGTTDRLHAGTAGHKAFRASFGPEDAELANKLVQHPWHVRDLLRGNNGTHYGAYQVWHLEKVVIPFLLSGS